MSERLKALADAGVSIWLDDLSRERLQTGNLQDLVANSSVVGVTTNPTIFAGALAKGNAYDDQVRDLARQGASVEQAITTITTDDVRNACDVMAATYAATDGKDGRVSIEVDPNLAMKTEETLSQAKELRRLVDRPNVMIKIPATKPGLPAITSAIGDGISVNVTLIFGLQRYREVIEAYLAGLEQAQQNGKDLSQIRSVASFFVSRVDTEYDKRLDPIGSPEAKQLKGKAAIANARLAYQVYLEKFNGDRWRALAANGAHEQRPLWASTGVKNPDYPDTMYVAELVVNDCVNTMPEKTLDAFADHGEVVGDRVTGFAGEAKQVMDSLAGLGIDYDEVIEVLETEGVDKFVKSYEELVQTVKDALSLAQSDNTEGSSAGGSSE